MALARWKELMKKYGKVAVGVHFSVSAASITTIYVAIKNNVDVEAILEKVGIHPDAGAGKNNDDPSSTSSDAAVVLGDGSTAPETTRPTGNLRNKTAELAASSGGALALAILCNKALFPVRVPITIALTPPIARFLARRNLLKGQV